MDGHIYLFSGSTAVWHRDAFVDETLLGADVLIEDLLNCEAAFKHLHLFLLLQHHFKPLLISQDLLLQRHLQLLQARRGHKSTFIQTVPSYTKLWRFF